MRDPFLILALILGVGAMTIVVWGARRATVAPLLSITWSIHSILWCILPLIIQQFLSEAIENSVGPLSRNQLAVLHSSLLLVLAIGFLAIRRPQVSAVTQFFDRTSPGIGRMFWPMIAALGLLVAVELGLSKVEGASFAEAVAFSVTADSSELAQSGLLSVLLGILLGFAIALISMGRARGVTRNTLVAAWSGLMAFSGFSISRGSRSVVLLPVAVGLIAISTLHGKARRSAITALVIVGCITVVIGAPVAGIMGLARGGSGALSFELVQEAYSVVFGGSTVGRQIEVLAEETNRKFDAVGPGVELLALEPIGSAGLRPFLSAGVSAVPRILYPSKPVPTSRDGTYLGTPYRIAAKAYGDPEVGMVVPVSATAISLWEFGVLGPLVFLLANMVNLVFFNTLLLSGNVFARALGISMLGLPNAEFFVAPPSSVLQNDLRMVLLMSLLALSLLAWDMLVKSGVISRRQPMRSKFRRAA
ncbi:MAG: hypothetical protein M3Y64_00290 [Gemmatimonadota bacterium]|nr:hypothetical protein [Gemmatimonadota bacterium]